MASELDRLSDDQLLELADKAGVNPTTIPNWNDSGIDTDAGAPFSARAGASFKSNPQEKLSYLKRALGPENVHHTEGGEIVWKNPKTGRWSSIDEAGFSVSDIADFAGDLPEILLSGAGAVAGGAAGATVGVPGGPPGIIAGLAGGGKLGATLGAAGGNIIKQFISAALPGEESLRVGERAGDVATAAALGFTSQGLGNLLGKGYKAIRGAPGNTAEAAARVVRRANDEQLLKTGLELESDIGGQLTPSQLTGNRILALIEGFQKRNPFAAETYEDFIIEKQMQPVKRRAEQLMGRAFSESAGDVSVGQALKETMESSIEKALDRTNRQAARDFGVMQGLGKNEPKIMLDNFERGLEEIVRRFSRPEFGRQANRMAGEASSILESMKRAYGADKIAGLGGARSGIAVSPKKMQEMLNVRGMSAYGKAHSLFEHAPKGLARDLEQQLHTLLRYDLEIAAIAGKGVGAKMLNVARKNYDRNISQVRGLQQSLLSKHLAGKVDQFGGERTMDWLRRLRPSELKATLGMLEPTEPMIRSMLQRNVMENAVEAGTRAAEVATKQYGVKTGRFSLEEFVKAMPSKEHMDIIFGESADSIGRDVARLIEFAERAAAIGPAGTIQQPLWRQLLGLVKNPSSIAALSVFGPQAMTQIFMDKTARKLLLGTAESASGAGSETVAKIIERIAQPLAYELGKAGADSRDHIIPSDTP